MRANILIFDKGGVWIGFFYGLGDGESLFLYKLPI